MTRNALPKPMASEPRRHSRLGGLLRGDPKPTLGITDAEAPSHLRRKKKPESGIGLIDL
jgi:hypothetical protein